MTRRDWLRSIPAGFGSLALQHVLAQDGLAQNGEAPKPHFAPRARAVIFLFMEGGPSQLDLFDPKPTLAKYNGQQLPESMRAGLRFAFIKPNARVWASTRKFARHGQSGAEISDLLPHTARQADRLCVVRSLHGDQFNHHPGQLLMHCGSPQPGRPSMGAWTIYGLGTESSDLPGFISLTSGRGGIASAAAFGSGFLPSTYGGVPFASSGEPVSYLTPPTTLDRDAQRARLDVIRALNQQHRDRTPDPAIDARIASYELAFRMQTAAPELLDLGKESARTLEAYGADREPTRAFARNCILARRMVERGVRFVLVTYATWDDHANLTSGHERHCRATDQPTAALLADLAQRGLLDETLVLWGGEFGRTPLAQTLDPGRESATGRDHHPDAFTMWLAGGGIRPGTTYGGTDELCMRPAEHPVHVHDLHATMLHCLGLRHDRLTHRHLGRDFRLTDVAGRVIPEILA